MSKINFESSSCEWDDLIIRSSELMIDLLDYQGVVVKNKQKFVSLVNSGKSFEYLYDDHSYDESIGGLDEAELKPHNEELGVEDSVDEMAAANEPFEGTDLHELCKKHKCSYKVLYMDQRGDYESLITFYSNDGNLILSYSHDYQSFNVMEATGTFSKYKSLAEKDKDYFDDLARKIKDKIDSSFSDWVCSAHIIKQNELEELEPEERELAKLHVVLTDDIQMLVVQSTYQDKTSDLVLATDSV